MIDEEVQNIFAQQIAKNQAIIKKNLEAIAEIDERLAKMQSVLDNLGDVLLYLEDTYEI